MPPATAVEMFGIADSAEVVMEVDKWPSGSDINKQANREIEMNKTETNTNMYKYNNKKKKEKIGNASPLGKARHLRIKRAKWKHELQRGGKHKRTDAWVNGSRERGMKEASQGEAELAAGACPAWAEACSEHGLTKGGRSPAAKIGTIFEFVGARVMQATTPDGQIGG